MKRISLFLIALLIAFPAFSQSKKELKKQVNIYQETIDEQNSKLDELATRMERMDKNLNKVDSVNNVLAEQLAANKQLEAQNKALEEKLAKMQAEADKKNAEKQAEAKKAASGPAVSKDYAAMAAKTPGILSEYLSSIGEVQEMPKVEKAFIYVFNNRCKAGQAKALNQVAMPNGFKIFKDAREINHNELSERFDGGGGGTRSWREYDTVRTYALRIICPDGAIIEAYNVKSTKHNATSKNYQYDRESMKKHNGY